MKFLIVVILFFGGLLAKASETIQFHSSLYAMTCSKTDGTCAIATPVNAVETIELDTEANGNWTGYFHKEAPVKSFIVGADIFAVHSQSGYYLLFITSWIQDSARTQPRAETHVSITVNSLAELNRINLPSPDMDGESDYGHTQFMIWAP